MNDQSGEDADETIYKCLDLVRPRSFFLYAGAGSGKTQSLVQAVRRVCREQGQRFSLDGHRIAVITYTNAACEEIKHRLDFDERVEVATIHAFSWSLISSFTNDIRKWVTARLEDDLGRLEKQQLTGRAGKAQDERARSIQNKRRRLEAIPHVRKFTYSPTGTNRGRDSLNHAEVIAMTASFLRSRAGFQRLVTLRYPIIVVDESQDTNKDMMDALLALQDKQRDHFSLGLFGDTMQRIYADGKHDLGTSIPASWAKPKKLVNFRCPQRVLRLINRIRQEADGQSQVAAPNALDGHARLFVVPEETADRQAVEALVAQRMSSVTGDPLWTASNGIVKTLTLEHKMAARRFGFEEFFVPLYDVDRLQTSLLEGKLPATSLFTHEVLPLFDAMASGDRFAAASIVRASSPLLDRTRLAELGGEQSDSLRRARSACDGLYALWGDQGEPTLLAVLQNVASTGLFNIHDTLLPFCSANTGEDDTEEDADDELAGWRDALGAPIHQVRKYHEYVNGLAPFDTHQGVKGREFDRVRVVISDSEAKGFMFSYDKLFGTKAPSKTDVENKAEGRDSSIDRSRRLFYVTCSRAKRSLAVVYYTSDPPAVKRAAVEKGWFEDTEIEVLQ